MPSAMPPTQEDRPVQEDGDLPTQDEYLAALSSDKRKPVSGEELEDCAICYYPMDGQEVVETFCKHTFCYACVRTWFEQSNTCPRCREELYEKSAEAAEATDYEIPWAEYEDSRIDAFEDLFMDWYAERFSPTGYEELDSLVEKMNVRLAEEYRHQFMPFEEAEVRQLFEASERTERGEDCAARFRVRGSGIYDMACRSGRDQWAQYIQSRNNAFDDLLMSGCGERFFTTGYEELSSFVDKMNERLEEAYPHQFKPFEEAKVLQRFEVYDRRPNCAGQFLIVGSGVYYMRSQAGVDQYVKRETEARKRRLAASDFLRQGYRVPVEHVALRLNRSLDRKYLWLKKADVIKFLEDAPQLEMVGDFVYRVEDLERGLFDDVYRVEDVEGLFAMGL